MRSCDSRWLMETTQLKSCLTLRPHSDQRLSCEIKISSLQSRDQNKTTLPQCYWFYFSWIVRDDNQFTTTTGGGVHTPMRITTRRSDANALCFCGHTRTVTSSIVDWLSRITVINRNQTACNPLFHQKKSHAQITIKRNIATKRCGMIDSINPAKNHAILSANK